MCMGSLVVYLSVSFCFIITKIAFPFLPVWAQPFLNFPPSISRYCSLDKSKYPLMISLFDRFLSGVGCPSMHDLWSRPCLLSVVCMSWNSWKNGEDVSVLGDESCMSCYCRNPVLYVCICHFTHVIMLFLKETNGMWRSFNELLENCRSLCHPDALGPLPSVDLAVCVAIELYKGVEGQE